jgi:hypothetical protein
MLSKREIVYSLAIFLIVLVILYVLQGYLCKRFEGFRFLSEIGLLSIASVLILYINLFSIIFVFVFRKKFHLTILRILKLAALTVILEFAACEGIGYIQMRHGWWCTDRDIVHLFGGLNLGQDLESAAGHLRDMRDNSCEISGNLKGDTTMHVLIETPCIPANVDRIIASKKIQGLTECFDTYCDSLIAMFSEKLDKSPELYLEHEIYSEGYKYYVWELPKYNFTIKKHFDDSEVEFWLCDKKLNCPWFAIPNAEIFRITPQGYKLIPDKSRQD